MTDTMACDPVDPVGARVAGRRRLTLPTIGSIFVAALGTTLSLAMLLAWLQTWPAGPPANSDFVIYYVGGVLHQAGQSPYDQEAQLALREVLTGVPVPRESVLYFLYPPAFLLVVLPLTSLPLPTASAAWGVLQLVALGGTCYTLRRQLSSWRWAALLCWLPFWLPVAAALKFGQVSPFLALGMVLFAVGIGRARARTGLWALLLFAKPQLMLLPALSLLLARQGRALAYLAGGLLVLGVASLAIVGINGVSAYIGSLAWAVAESGSGAVWRDSTYSWASVARGAGQWEGPVTLLLDGATVAIWVWLLRRRGVGEAAGAAGIAATLISPHTMIYDLSLWLAAVPALCRRRIIWSLPLLVGSLIVPWVSHAALGEPWPSVLWAAIVLTGLAGTKPALAERNVAVAGGVQGLSGIA